MERKTIRLGIGFATGRKSFRKVLEAYIYSWKEFLKRGPSDVQVHLGLFIAYDLDYSDTQSTDFTNLPQEIVDAFDDIVFLGAKNAQRNLLRMLSDGSVSEREVKLLFGGGYAGKRNAILYAALEAGMDAILYLDDDEYPVAVTNNRGTCLWGGQYVLPMHLKYIDGADITNGHHCGYISPIPQISFNEWLTQDELARFIGAISNDIISWDSIREKMERGGVTYADTAVLISEQAVPVEEVRGCKFISGSNLCINLRRPERVSPFFNPPGARGEDTFLSTLLSERTVLRIPCYTFHDGFSAYRHLLDGVLPLNLSPITPDDPGVVKRFYNACIGWVRYKPLLLMLTDPENYATQIAAMRDTLAAVLPRICGYFGQSCFMKILAELDRYNRNVRRHQKQFLETQGAWDKLLRQLRARDEHAKRTP